MEEEEIAAPPAKRARRTRLRREDPEPRGTAPTLPPQWTADTASVIAGFCDDRALGRLRTANVTLWRWFGYNAAWAHLDRTGAADYNLPEETPYVTQRAFHWCRMLDLRSSWEDDRAEHVNRCRRYEREHARVTDAALVNASIARHCTAKRRVEQTFQKLSWPDPTLSLRQHAAPVSYTHLTLPTICSV